MSRDDTRAPIAPVQQKLPVYPLPLWTLPIWIALVAACVFIDAPTAQAMETLRDKLGGDIKRELETAQQFGALGSIVLVGVIILLLDQKNARKVINLAAAMIATSVAALAVKMLVGRPRPRFLLGADGREADPDAHLSFLMPWGTYQIDPTEPARHAWEITADIGSGLWAFPSSHTAAAVALATFLSWTYPRIIPLAVSLAVFVGCARVLFGAHYPSDVVAGALLGMVVSRAVLNLDLASRFKGHPQPD